MLKWFILVWIRENLYVSYQGSTPTSIGLPGPTIIFVFLSWKSTWGIYVGKRRCHRTTRRVSTDSNNTQHTWKILEGRQKSKSLLGVSSPTCLRQMIFSFTGNGKQITIILQKIKSSLGASSPAWSRQVISKVFLLSDFWRTVSFCPKAVITYHRWLLRRSWFSENVFLTLHTVVCVFVAEKGDYFWRMYWHTLQNDHFLQWTAAEKGIA